MKKTNKGFSLVELIIVIAIMAILAGALAPALIKYINKSRISTDIQTANTIATAIQTALSTEKGYDAPSATDQSTAVGVSTIFNASGDDFQKSVAQTIGGSTAPKVKASKCMNGTILSSSTSNDFKYVLEKNTNKIVIYSADGTHKLYPEASACLTDDTLTQCTP